jgi:hypothetical protein
MTTRSGDRNRRAFTWVNLDVHLSTERTGAYLAVSDNPPKRVVKRIPLERGKEFIMSTRAQAEAPMSGWALFAAMWLIVAGSFNIINGITAIHRGSYYINQLLFSSLSTWGWIILIVGIAQALAAFMVFARNPTGNLIGVVVASVAMFIWFFFLFASPFGALIAVIINGLVIYGLLIGNQPSY